MNIHCRLVHDFAQCLLSQSGWKGVERSGVVVLVVAAIAMFAFDFPSIQQHTAFGRHC